VWLLSCDATIARFIPRREDSRRKKTPTASQGTQVKKNIFGAPGFAFPGTGKLVRGKHCVRGLGLLRSKDVTRKEIAMQKILTYVLAVGCVGTSAMLVQRDVTLHQEQIADVQLANDAAFRDGLYLGRLAHAANRQTLPPIGRWSTEKDRASFTAGYKQGFAEESSRQ
jgi:hypothetical protein